MNHFSQNRNPPSSKLSSGEALFSLSQIWKRWASHRRDIDTFKAHRAFLPNLRALVLYLPRGGTRQLAAVSTVLCVGSFARGSIATSPLTTV